MVAATSRFIPWAEEPTAQSWGSPAMSEVKNRKKSGSKGAPAADAGGKRSEGGKSAEVRGGGGRSWADPRTGLSLLSLGMCLGLAW